MLIARPRGKVSNMAPSKLLRAMVFLAGLGPMVAQQGQTPPVMPKWLVSFPGVTARVRTSTLLVEARYETTAPVAEVMAHYRKLFEGAGLPFHANATGMGVSIRGAAPECALLIQISQQGYGSQVQVSCAVEPAAPPPGAVPAQAEDAPPKPFFAEKEKSHIQGMEKYDQPVYPRPKAPLPPLVWPSWLVHCDGGVFTVQKGVDRFKLNYLKAQFTSQSDRGKIQSFYANLLNAHGYAVYAQSSPRLPDSREATVEGAHYFGDAPGPGFVIRVRLTAVAGGTDVELLLTSHP
jgi:hypothetical protein